MIKTPVSSANQGSQSTLPFVLAQQGPPAPMQQRGIVAIDAVGLQNIVDFAQTANDGGTAQQAGHHHQHFDHQQLHDIGLGADPHGRIARHIAGQHDIGQSCQRRMAARDGDDGGPARFGQPLSIKDVTGNAAANNITVKPVNPETIDSYTNAAPLVIDANYGGVKLSPGTAKYVIAP